MAFISTKELGKRLGINASRVRQLLKDGRVPGAEKVGRDWIIPEESVAKVKRLPAHRPRKGATSGEE